MSTKSAEKSLHMIHKKTKVKRKREIAQGSTTIQPTGSGTHFIFVNRQRGKNILSSFLVCMIEFIGMTHTQDFQVIL